MDVPTLMYNLKEEVSCSVCMQLYTEPKQLPCLHIFCLQCLNNIARTSAQHGTIKCPLCQIEVAVPESGTMEILPSCFYVKNLLDILAIKECNTSKVTCGNCQMKSEEASYCFHCGGFWCKACIDAHNILRANRDHRVLALKDFQDQDFEVVLKRPAFCQKELHEKEVLKFYCKMCEIPVCQNCVTVEHGGHAVEYLEVTARGVKHNMAAQLDAAKKETQTFSSCLRGLEEKSRGIEQRSQFVKRQIQDAVKSLILNLQQRERELITDVEKETKIEQDRVTKDKTKISDHLKKIEGTMLQAKQFIDRSTAAELVRSKAFVSELLEEIPEPVSIASTCESETLNIVFVENEPLSKSLQNTGIGVLKKLAVIQANRCTVEGFTEAAAGLETRFKLITRNAEGKQSYSPGDCVVVELASTEDGKLAGEMKIVDNKNGSYEVSCIPKRKGEHKVTVRVNGEEIGDHPAIHVKKRSYKLVRTVGGEGTGAGEFDNPWGVAVNDKNEIIVCDTYNDRLQVFNEKGDFIRTIEHELMINPTGMCIDSTGRIYVTAENKILLFNPNGDYIKEISDEENQDVDWYGISLDEQGNIIVCNQNNNSYYKLNYAVHILSPEGKPLKKLSRDDFDPVDCLYYERKIFVCNMATNTIDVFDCEGTFLKEIGNQGSGNGEFSYPAALAIDKTGHLVITDDNGVQVFTLDGMFVTKFGGDSLSYPRGVSVLKDGRVIVTDYEKDKLLIFE